MPPPPGIPQIDQSRPECVALAKRIRELRALQQRYRDLLQQTQDPEEREQILDILAGLEEQISARQEELAFEQCYVLPAVHGLFLKVVGVEATQSTQYHSIEGTGAGANNSIRFVANKATLARVYLTSDFDHAVSVTGRLKVYGFNDSTLKYDLLRKTYIPDASVTMPASGRSRRSIYHETLNFRIPAADCVGKVRFDVLVWVADHEGDPVYEGEGVVAPVDFLPQRVPIIYCYRIAYTQTKPATTPGGTPTQTALTAPTDAACRTTMQVAERIFPLSDLDVRDRGTVGLSGRLEVRQDYDAVRLAIQGLRDGTTPTPQDHEIFVGMLPSHTNAQGRVWGHADAFTVESIVGDDMLFAHEFGHLLLPGVDHVRDAVCPNNSLMTGDVDTNYPDYANTTRASGIGEFGVDLGASPPTVYGPDTLDLMGYCDPRWISPYNYARAMTGPVLERAASAGPSRTEVQKLLLGFRVHRDGGVEFASGIHLPGEPRPFPAKSATGLVIELHGEDGDLLVSAQCRQRGLDRLGTAPYQDFREVLPWDEHTAYVVIVRDGREAARWEVEGPRSEPPITNLTVEQGSREDGVTTYSVSWDLPDRTTPLYTVLRWTPDDGRTWLPVAPGGPQEGHLDVESDHLPGREGGRFQLAVSTGFRTTLLESDPVSLPRRERNVEISLPMDQAHVAHGQPIWLVGADRRGSFDGVSEVVYWTSNRDGFLGDGFRVPADRLSPGRHVLTLTVVDADGAEQKQSVVIHVRQAGNGPADP